MHPLAWLVSHPYNSRSIAKGWFLVITNLRRWFWFHAERRRSSWLTPKEIVAYIEGIRLGKSVHQVEEEEKMAAEEAQKAAEEERQRSELEATPETVDEPPTKKPKVTETPSRLSPDEQKLQYHVCIDVFLLVK